MGEKNKESLQTLVKLFIFIVFHPESYEMRSQSCFLILLDVFLRSIFVQRRKNVIARLLILLIVVFDESFAHEKQTLQQPFRVCDLARFDDVTDCPNNHLLELVILLFGQVNQLVCHF